MWLTNVSHAVNHFQNQMISALYRVIMAELGFGYFQLGTLTAIRVVFGNGSQIVYGFLTIGVAEGTSLSGGSPRKEPTLKRGRLRSEVRAEQRLAAGGQQVHPAQRGLPRPVSSP